MRLSNSFFYTLRENVRDEESISGNLLVKSGMIKKVGNGIYTYMPLGLKVLQNIENIVREEMNNAGAQELRMPQLLPQEVFEASGRLNNFGSSMFKLKDRYNRPLALGPTHEELFAMAAGSMIKSYKDMPFNLYQIGNKYRDEVRPRLGLIRVREFIMKDAYSFDVDLEGLDNSYKKMYVAYNRIFDRIGLDYKIVRADTGLMGGFLSEEYQAITDTGEDLLALCSNCNYATNVEVASVAIEDSTDEYKSLELVETPNCKSIDDVCKFLNIDKKNSVKALLMNVNGEFVVFFIRGDRELSEAKVCKLMGVEEFNFADDALIEKSNAVPGFTGPKDLKAKIVIDDEILHMRNFCFGANKENYHYINGNVSDFKYDIVGDIKQPIEGDKCPKCNGELYFKRGIEVGNLFKLGTKYCEALNISYLDKDNKLNYPYMGCYGLGVPRVMASVVEQSHDDKGIIWPYSIAPYKVAIIIISTKDEKQVGIAQDLYNRLNNLGIDTILDDRDVRPGVKFNDMDLIGIPVRITIGKKVSDDIVELKLRSSEEIKEINIDSVIEEIENIK